MERGSLSACLGFGSVVLLDGALATELEARGADINSKLWSASTLIQNPSLIESVHCDYYRAGADVAITASYQASYPGLASCMGYNEEQSDAVFHTSVRLALNARNDVRKAFPLRTLFVAGSIGPYGAYLSDGSEYRGDYHLSTEEMKAFHRPRIATLIAAGVDVLALETMPSYAELCSLCSLLEEQFVSTECWVSVTLRDAAHISDGTPLAKVCELLDRCKNVIAVGVNCVPKHLVTPSLSEMRKHTTKALVAYPNSGEQWDAATKTWKQFSSETGEWDTLVMEWYSVGARLIGGCCRTGPEDIRLIRASVDAVLQSNQI